VIVLSQKRNQATTKEVLDPMVGWRVDKILASSAFEHLITGESPELTKVLNEASILSGKVKGQRQRMTDMEQLSI